MQKVVKMSNNDAKLKTALSVMDSMTSWASEKPTWKDYIFFAAMLLPFLF